MGKLWAMFFLSILLVSVMNFYAEVREPDRVDIAEIHEHIRESVKVQGVLTSYVRDPYSDGSDRIDLLLEDEYNVVEIRWTETGMRQSGREDGLPATLPPIGTVVEGVGEVVEWNGKIWIQSQGAGAITYDARWVPDVHLLSLTDLSHSPSTYAGDLITLTGYAGGVIEANITRQTFSLMDSPSYSNADHIISTSMEGRLTETLEAGSKIKLTGWLRWDERSFRWQLQTHATQIDVLWAAGAKRLSWSSDAVFWSYDVGSLVTLEGTSANLSDGWWVMGPGDAGQNKLCLLPAPGDQDGISQDWTGRLVWEEQKIQLCLDHGYDAEFTNPTGGIGEEMVPLGDVVRDPNAYRNQTLNFEGWSTDPISPDYNKGYFADGPDYFTRSTRVRMVLEGARAEWLEADTMVRINATVIWDTADARLILQVHAITLIGPTPNPVTLSWTEGFDDWQWDINKRVKISGIATNGSDGTLWISREGSAIGERLCLLGDGSELAAQTEAGAQPLDWVGRLTTEENVADREVKLCLDRR